MAQTTTAISACDASIWLDDEAGALTDISGSSSVLNFEFVQDTAIVPTFQSDWKIRTACGRDATVTLTAVYTTANSEAVDLIKDWFFNYRGTKRTLTFYLPDKNVGSDKYSGEFLMTGFSSTISGGTPDPVTVEMGLESSGAVTWTTAAT